MSQGPAENERQVFRQLAAEEAPGIFETHERMRTAYLEIDAEAHGSSTPTEHSDDEMIVVVEDTNNVDEGFYRRSLIGLNDTTEEIYLGLPISPGRSVFTSQLDLSIGFGGKHMDILTDPLVIAATLEELVQKLQQGKARATIKKL